MSLSRETHILAAPSPNGDTEQLLGAGLGSTVQTDT